VLRKFFALAFLLGTAGNIPFPGIDVAGFGIESATAAEIDPLDWPNWLGPNQNRISLETGLINEFDPDGGPGSNVLWKNEAAGSISTPIVMNGRLYTIARHEPNTPVDAEKVMCLDADTGKVLWETVYNVFLSDLPAERVGWSNVCGDPITDRVYVLGACCLFQCFDGKTGNVLWQRSLSEEYGMLSTYGGRTNTPVVFEDLVIISGVTTGWDDTAKPSHRFLAFNKTDGTLVWIATTGLLPEDTTYSTPVIKVIDGQPVFVAGAGDGGLYGIQPRTGKILWKEQLSRRGINTSPAIDDKGNVFAAHGEENPEGTAMGAVIRIDGNYAALGSTSAEQWRTEEITVGKSSPLLVGNHLFVVEDSSKMHMIDTETGSPVGMPVKLGTAMRGTLLYADGKIYGCTTTGIFHILKPEDDGVKSVFKVRMPRGVEVGGSPIVSHGKIYMPTTLGLYCLGNSNGKPSAISDTKSPAEDDLSRNPEAAQLQLIPAEAIVAAGDTIQFKVAAFNSKGQRLASLPPGMTFETSGGFSIDASGKLVAGNASDTKHQAAIVKVKQGTLTAMARIRIVPQLPWKFDFSDGQVPITWIGARYRHEAEVIDNDPAIVKVSTIPKGTRSQTWFASPNYSNYTITADVKANESLKQHPDMGVIAQRYSFLMGGEAQHLQIRTWPAQLRMARSVPFKWEVGKWYTIKLKSSLDGGIAVLKGKAWLRDEKEPEDWMLTATDDSPNPIGSPGMFGSSTNGEYAIDNVIVEAN
jgi:outer membrane protein assembly factor BamB